MENLVDLQYCPKFNYEIITKIKSNLLNLLNKFPN